MKITKITYQRVKNLGNYESERLEIEVETNEKENYESKVKEMKKFVEKNLNIEKKDDDENIEIPFG